MYNCTVSVTKNGITRDFYAEKGESILSLLRRENIFLPAFCGGKEMCGKCRVTASGELTPPSESEKSLLTEEMLKAGTRLACCAHIEGDASVTVPSDGAYQVLTDFGGKQEETAYPACFERIGAAIDIGTTTIAVYFYSLDTNKRVCVMTALNSQQILGADVISRIKYCEENADGGDYAKSLITRQLCGIFDGFSKKHGISKQRIVSVAIAANTTMLSLLSGVSTRPLASSPFKAADLFGSFYTAEQLGLDLGAANVYLLPSVSAFVGADITAGILSSGIYESDKNALLIDFGTNGEMALKYGGKLYCCSTAAGPAFEGARISCGCGGIDGGINRAYASADGLVTETVGGCKPVGICGSGLIDIAAYLLDRGTVDSSGYMEKSFEAAEGIYLTPKDIRELQLAKAAVSAGVKALLAAAGAGISSLDEVYLTGGFGAAINIESAVRIGLLPLSGAKCVVKPLGNCAAAGAVSVLLDPAAMGAAEEIASAAQVVELETDRVFNEMFIEDMSF